MTEASAHSARNHEVLEAALGHSPVTWQHRLFEKFLSGSLPDLLDLPTGLGKTSVMSIWLAARACGAQLPRRLVYVVDRRAVVDQATDEANRLALLAKEKKLTGSGVVDLSVSTLRGQHADNREWLADPSTPSIIVGTVDMIGSRLLFQGYGTSRGIRPYMAGLLGVDTLVVLDEAHLVPPFEHLLRTITHPSAPLAAWPEQGDLEGVPPPVRLLSLSATSRDKGSQAGDGGVFGLKAEDREDPWIASRLGARKRLRLEKAVDDKSLANELAKQVWNLAEGKTDARLLIFCDRRSDAEKIQDALNKTSKELKLEVKVELLVGARRIFEREQVADWLRRNGFTAIPGGNVNADTPPSGLRCLIATSAGEVGVDMDADHMVCDLVEWDRMAQRLGRVNRRGNGNAQIVVVPVEDGTKKDDTRPGLAARQAAIELLPKLAEEQSEEQTAERKAKPLYDASPGALASLGTRAGTEPEVEAVLIAGTTPEPLRPALTRPILDAWSMTSLTDHTGRPEIAPWLRGWVDEDEPQTTLIWREFLPVPRQGGRPQADTVERFFAAARPHLLEQLEVSTDQVATIFSGKNGRASKCLSERGTSTDGTEPLHANQTVALVLSPSLTFEDAFTLEQLSEQSSQSMRRRLADRLVVLDARLGGLAESGLLNRENERTDRTADASPPFGLLDEKDAQQMRSLLGWHVELNATSADDDSAHEAAPAGFTLERSVPVAFNQDGDPTAELYVYVSRRSGPSEGDPAIAAHEQGLSEHHFRTEAHARRLASSLGLPPRLADILAIAAAGHDLGKDRSRAGLGRDWWQDAMSAPADKGIRPLAKTSGPLRPQLLRGYRHEFGSLRDIEDDERFQALDEDARDLVRHLIVAHHGYARPVIRAVDPALPDGAPALKRRAREAAIRFIRLQKRYGPWRLAWLEAVLRAADWKASADNNAGSAPANSEAAE